jgi:hypothetical protein
MSTMEAHSQEGWTRQAGHHIQKAKHHSGLSKAHSEMADAHKAMMDHHDKGTPEHEFHKSAHAFHLKKAESHDGMADEHTDMGEFCIECAKSLSQAQKAMGMDRDEITPDHVSAIAPEMPHIRAILRAGQRDLAEMSKVDAVLEPLLKLDD